jgi:hypothetical protein
MRKEQMMSTCCDDVEEDVLVDYSGQSEFKNALIAQGKGRNFLRLAKLDTPVDGAQFELTYRWLSQKCERERDQAFCCVRGAEVSYWKISEMINGPKLMRDIKAGKANLFEHFNLF